MKNRYGKEILARFKNPKRIGSMDDKDQNVGIGQVGAVACGDVLRVSIKVIDNVIQDVKILIFGCVTAFASADYLSEILIGKTISEALNITNDQIAKHLMLPEIKIHCSVLAKEAIQAAIDNYVKKHGIVNQPKTYGDMYTKRKELDAEMNKCRSECDTKVVNIHTTDSDSSELNTGSVNISNYAFEKLSLFFREKQNFCLKVYVEKFGCGVMYRYSIIDSSFVDTTYTTLDFVKFKVVFLKMHKLYISGLEIDFVEKDLTSFITFKKVNGVKNCACGSSFNIKL